jgi:DNA-binding response OmpR family regulator
MAAAVGTFDVLGVDADPAIGVMVKSIADQATSRVRTAVSVDQAQAEMKRKPADLVLVNLQINDSAGVQLIKTLKAKHPQSQVIAVSRVKRSELCLDAWRAGAADMLLTPVQPQDLKRSLDSVLKQRDPSSGVEKLTRRNVRLRSVCKQLNKARHEIRQQVDLLCNDLVRAYQDMAHQLNTTQLAVDYANMVANEIEVEAILRKTMEWILGKLGPVNAAIYLSDSERHFALGAYLNLDTEADAPLINSLGETLIQHTASSSRSVTLESDRHIDELFGEQGAKLKERAWLSTGCFAAAPKNDCLAVLVVFRKQGEPMDAMRGMIEAIAPIVGEKIEQALELYHRMHPHDDLDTDTDTDTDLEDESDS